LARVATTQTLPELLHLLFLSVSMVALSRCLASLALVLPGADSARINRRDGAEVQTKVVAGVAIHNYNLRHLQSEEGTFTTASTEYEWIVMFEKGKSDEQLANFCAGSCIVSGHPSKGGVPFVTIVGSEDKLRTMIEAHPEGIEFAEPDLAVFTIPEVPEQAATVDHWGLDRIAMGRASSTGKGVHIYVMDTGTRVSHSDFGGRAIATIDTVIGNGRAVECQNSDDENCGRDTNGHGTHTAGSAGGTKWGVAPESIIHAMKVCCGRGTNTLAGMDWIAQNAEKPALVTMSLGSHGTSMSSKAAVERVVESGIAVFVSAGNNNIDSCRKTYAFIEASITVGASDESDNRASFSNYGSCLDIYAPGTRIPSASNRDDTGIVSKSGTSMATPLAAGAGALLLQKDPSMSPAKLKSRMTSMAFEGVLGSMEDGDPNLLLNVA